MVQQPYDIFYGHLFPKWSLANTGMNSAYGKFESSIDGQLL